MASGPQYEGTPVVVTQVVANANASRSGAGPLTGLLVGGVNPMPGGTNSTIGTRVDTIFAQWQTTSTAGTFRLFLNGMMFKEVVSNAVTVGVGTAAFSYAFQNLALTLPLGAVLAAANNNTAETVGVVLIAGLL